MSAHVKFLLAILSLALMVSSCDSTNDPSDSEPPYRLMFFYASSTGDVLPGVYAEKLNESGVVRLTPDTLKGFFFAASPDESKLLYSATSATGDQHDLYLQPRGSRNGTLIVSHPTSDFSPQWLSDGSGIAFLSMRSGNQALWLADVNGSNQRLGAPDSGHVYRFAVSPVGTRIALTYDYSRLVIVDYLTGIRTYPVPDSISVHAGSLAWSPDASRLSFAIGDSLYTWSQATGAELQYVNDDLIAGTAWCPTGPYIAFNSRSKIKLLNTNEHTVTTLGSDMRWGGHLEWTPDGMYLGYEASDMVNPPFVNMVARDGRSIRKIESANMPIWTLLSW